MRRRGICAALLAAVALSGCSRTPDIVVRQSPDTSPSPSPTPSAQPSSPSPEPSSSIDYSAYNVCSASVSRAAPPAGGRQTLRIRSNLANAQVTAVATYASSTQPLAGKTDAEGRTEIVFKTLNGARPGTAVRVDVTVAPTTRCSTTFTIS